MSSRLEAVESAVLALTQPRWLGHNSAGPLGGVHQQRPAEISTKADVHLGGAVIATHAVSVGGHSLLWSAVKGTLT